MENNWKKVRLGEICTIRRGSSPRPIVDYMASQGMPWVKISDATESKTRYINKTNEFIKHEGVGRSVIVNEGDLILSNSGTAGLPKFMGITACIHDGWQVFSNLIGIDKEFLYYTLLNIRAKLLHNAYDSTMKNLTLDMVRDAEIMLPTIDEQKAIASILSSVDKKIENTLDMNQTLEQMAQSLFKSWFVDFDPVVDNALDAGFFERDLEFSDELLRRAEARKAVRGSADFKPLLEDIRQLFPAAFEECSEPSLGLGGWVPEGWKHGCISDVARYRTERVDTTELTLDNYISTENMLADRKGVQPATSLPTVNSVPSYTSGTVLVSNIRPYFKKIWLAKGDGGYSNDVLGFEAKVSGTESYLFNLMYQDTFFDFMMATSKGSKMPRGDKKAILGWNLVVPTLSLRLFFSEKVNDFYTSADSRHHENITLNQLRDTLLPKLISGELCLSDSEVDTAEEVLA
ncbi:restriction endonuclease subunit S [Hafnia alvei]|uniref:restriction endonuclease subunit S n=1 Tax=Hafnia alvei TaxID=569 RepID=UPI0028BE4A4C|nr:restriction endonuclease subunit S [Hafnia alvei]WNN51976.1 restriction endonuclease subunit S [Hafnia alvei]